MEGYVLVDNGRLTEKEARLNMEQCADFLARMIQKYGPEILEELAEKEQKNPGNESDTVGGFRAAGSFSIQSAQIKNISSCNSPAYKSGYPRHNERTVGCVTMGIRKGG